jgi:anthranilate/para-aminobenzoate synthase component I
VSGSVVVEKLMEVERYSHVMHISSTVTGRLLPQLDSWDALRAALPAGTVSGAPKVCRDLLMVVNQKQECFVVYCGENMGGWGIVYRAAPPAGTVSGAPKVRNQDSTC